MRNIPADDHFDTLGDSIAKSLGGKPGDKKDITQNDVPGKEFTVETKTGFARVQLYTVGGFVIYAVVAGKTKDDLTSKNAEAFFGSLKLSDKAKETFAKLKR